MQHNWCRRLQHWITPAATRKLCLRSVLEPQLPEGLTTGVRRVWNVSSFSWMCWWLAEQDFFEEIKPYFLKLLQSARPWGQIGKGGWTIEVWDFETAVLRVWPFGCSPPLRCYPARRKLARKKLSVLSICSLCTRFHWPLSPQDNVEACRWWILSISVCVQVWEQLVIDAESFDGSHEKQNSSRLPFTCPTVPPGKKTQMILYFEQRHERPVLFWRGKRDMDGYEHRT